MEKKRVMVACSMIEDEIKVALERSGLDLPVIWMDRGLHNVPDDLRAKLQEQVDQLQDYEEILLCYGLCGNGTAGIVSPKATLVIPKFDDCINMMLCTGKRKSRGLVQAGVMYLTAGWTNDQGGILQQYDEVMERFDGDEELVEAVMEMMYENYETIAMIDTGCYDKAAAWEIMEKSAKLLDLDMTEVSGSIQIMEKLITGDYDENFIILNPGEVLTFDHFQFV